MNYQNLASELISRLRGKRSQKRLSEQLGYSSNILYRWESGDCYPASEVFFSLAEKVGRPSHELAGKFVPHLVPWSEGALTSRDAVLSFLEGIVGKMSIGALARAMGKSRYVVSRWLDGTTALRLPDLLRLLEVCTDRLLDFVAVLVDPKLLPSVAREWLLLEEARKAADEHPWTHAVLRALELSQYRRLKRHRSSWVASRIGVDEEEVRACIEVLQKGGQIRCEGAHFRVMNEHAVDMRKSPGHRRRLTAFWMKVASERYARAQQGAFGYNLCSLSEVDYKRIKELHREFYQQMQQVISQSKSCERVLLFNSQLLPLDEPRG